MIPVNPVSDLTFDILSTHHDHGVRSNIPRATKEINPFISPSLGLFLGFPVAGLISL
jgi:hypothetical protein